ncbi:earmuff [Carabus blaptoides fortunei]
MFNSEDIMSSANLPFPNDPYTCEKAVLGMKNAYIKEEKPNKDVTLNDLAESRDPMSTTMDGNSNLVTEISNMPVEHNTKKETHFIKYCFKEGKYIKVWECGLCGKEFGHQYTLLRHLPTHTDERKYQCTTCGKAFRQMSTLCQHKAIHSVARPYTCEICQKSFNRVSTLMSHKKTHSGHKPHKCAYCHKAFHQKEFSKRIAFRNHELYEHQKTSGSDTLMSSATSSTSELNSSRDRPNTVATPQVKYDGGILVDPINTDAMKIALQTNQTPFVLLKPLNGVPVIVRVIEIEDKHLLVPITWDELCRQSQIAIIQAPHNLNESMNIATTNTNSAFKLQVKIPIVATVKELGNFDESLCMSVHNPGPNNTIEDGNIIYSMNEKLDEMEADPCTYFQDTSTKAYNMKQLSEEIEYLNKIENILTNEDYNPKLNFPQFNSAQFNLNLEDPFVTQAFQMNNEEIPMVDPNIITPVSNSDGCTMNTDITLTDLDTKQTYEVSHTA